jgi:hypothetical protein
MTHTRTPADNPYPDLVAVDLGLPGAAGGWIRRAP